MKGASARCTGGSLPPLRLILKHKELARRKKLLSSNQVNASMRGPAKEETERAEGLEAV